MKYDKIKTGIERYYSQKFRTHGATHAGVDWNSQESQQLRFDRLLQICDSSRRFLINDLGCGYGALYDYLRKRDVDFEYIGYDLSRPMIDYARLQHTSAGNCVFVVGDDMTLADYSIASGIFNIKVERSDEEWKQYILDTITRMDARSRLGFAFNSLTMYSDRELMKDDLYYADPCFFFDYCKRHFSKDVALLHDYGLYEFTILVRKGG